MRTEILSISTPSGESCISKVKFDHLGSHRSSQVMAVLQRHVILFDGPAPLGKVPNIKHHIPTHSQFKPYTHSPMEVTESVRDIIREECDIMLR